MSNPAGGSTAAPPYRAEKLRFERVQEGHLDMASADSCRAGRPSSPLEAWTIAVLAGFGILHVVAGDMLHHASSVRAVETATIAIYCD